MFIAPLRQLWRFRTLVTIGVVIAIFIQIALLYRISPGVPPKFESRQYYVGVASAAVLIDSQTSQAVDLGGSGEVKVDVASLSARAKLLANLLVTRPLRDDIARMSGVQTDRLITGLSSTTDEGAPPPAASDVKITRQDPHANILDLQTSDAVPIVTVNAQAPREETAARLAASTVTTLRRYLEEVADANAVPDGRKLVMRPLGRPTSARAVRGPRNMTAALLFTMLVGLWCGGILAVSGLTRAWRQAAADEGDAPYDELAPDYENEATGRPLSLRVGVGPDDEAGASPSSQAASRVA